MRCRGTRRSSDEGGGSSGAGGTSGGGGGSGPDPSKPRLRNQNYYRRQKINYNYYSP